MAYNRPALRVPSRIADCTALSVRTTRAAGSGDKKKRPPITHHVDIAELSQIVLALIARHNLDLTAAQHGIVIAIARNAIVSGQDVETIVLWECELMNVDIVVPVVKAERNRPTVLTTDHDRKRACDMSEDDRAAFLASREARKNKKDFS